MAPKTDSLAWDKHRLQRPHDQQDKAQRVRAMFDAIAPTYELINSLASGGRDEYWRSCMVRLADVQPDDLLLDIACGTGDVARAFASGTVRPQRIVGLDFSLPMLEQAASRPISAGDFCQGNALKLPFRNESASIVTCAFGIRNFQDLDTAAEEMYRVLRMGGRAVILEFSLPRVLVLRHLYLFYFKCIMPVLATLIGKDRSGAYRYLPKSVLSFHRREAIISCFRAAGFSQVTVHPLTWGIVAVYVAGKAG